RKILFLLSDLPSNPDIRSLATWAEENERGTLLSPPLKGVLIPEKTGETRLLGIPTVADRDWVSAKVIN
ncbi:MAG: hypothetical protein WCL46_07380, partial [Chlorobium sp.]